MADILLDEQSAPSSPASGQGIYYVDSTVSKAAFVDDAGRKYIITGGGMTNASIANQTVNAADTYLTDSDILLPSFGMQARARIVWTVSASKTAAGVATPIYNIRIGAARTTSDTARLTLTGPAQTAIADIGTLTVMVTVRSVGASGVLQGTAWWVHRGTAANTTTSGTGFANDTSGHVEATSAGFDNSALAGQYIGLSVHSGTAGVWTVTQVHVTKDW
jgi:hypothetical protein